MENSLYSKIEANFVCLSITSRMYYFVRRKKTAIITSHNDGSSNSERQVNGEMLLCFLGEVFLEVQIRVL
jgi:hypothetical protein